MNSNIVKSLKYSLALQFIVKLFTFVINQIIIKRVGPSTFGLVALKFELFYSLIISISREAIRYVLLRVDFPEYVANKNGRIANTRKQEEQSCESKRKFDHMFNLALMCFLVGLFVSWCFLAFLLDKFDFNSGRFYHFYMWYAVAALLELLSEPAFLACQNLHMYSLRSVVEVVALAVKCLSTYMMLEYNIETLQTFTLAQFIYSVALLFGYFGVFIHLRRTIPFVQWNFRSFKPSNFDLQQVKLSCSFFLQSIIKIVLSEGDKLVASMFSSSEDQGIYALVSNYGSLVVRMIFLPVEESFRSNAGKAQLGTFNSFYAKAMKWYTYLLVLCLVFTRHGSHIFVSVMLGPKWKGASDLINVYMIYVATLGLNGISEAYLHSISDEKQVLWNTAFMTCFSGIYIGLSVQFQTMGYGMEGLVYANILNSVMRIVYSNIFVIRKTGSVEFKVAISGMKYAIILIVASDAFIRTLEVFMFPAYVIFGIAVICGVACLSFIVFKETSLIKSKHE